MRALHSRDSALKVPTPDMTSERGAPKATPLNLALERTHRRFHRNSLQYNQHAGGRHAS